MCVFLHLKLIFRIEYLNNRINYSCVQVLSVTSQHARRAGVFTWPVDPLGADGPPDLLHSVVALVLRLVQVPLVHRGPEQTLLSRVLRHSQNVVVISSALH